MTPPRAADIAAGDVLPSLEIPVTATVIAAGAIATRDFMPVHHDRAYANQQGAQDIFMNILSDTGYCSRFITDWAGPDAMIKRLAIRLGAPSMPGHTLSYSGEVESINQEGDGYVIEVVFRATGGGADHLTGTATVNLPLDH